MHEIPRGFVRLSAVFIKIKTNYNSVKSVEKQISYDHLNKQRSVKKNIYKDEESIKVLARPILVLTCLTLKGITLDVVKYFQVVGLISFVVLFRLK